jgi:hypothetical protein
MMGYNIDEIYNFMTSPAVEFISELLDTNRFN